jgi:hypothetical protein
MASGMLITTARLPGDTSKSDKNQRFQNNTEGRPAPALSILFQDGLRLNEHPKLLEVIQTIYTRQGQEASFVA